MRVFLLYPEWRRSCKDCMKWHYGPDGEPMEHPIGSGNKMPNLECITPCSGCPKIPKGRPKERQYAEELTERSYKIWQHWRECRAINQFPNDPLVKRHAAILRSIYDELDKKPMHSLLTLLASSVK